MGNAFKKVVQRVSLYAGVGGMFTLLVMMLLTTFDVIGRKFFSLPIPGSYELSKYMLAVFVLLGIAYTQQMEGHVSINLVVARMPLRTQLVIDSIVTLLGLFIFSLIIWGGWVETVLTMQAGTVSDMLYIPVFPFKFLVSLGAFLVCLELLLKVIASVTEAVKKRSLGKGVIA